MLLGMPEMTSVKMTVQTRDELRELAEREGLTMEKVIKRMLRRDRLARMREQLASWEPTAEESMIIDSSRRDVGGMLAQIDGGDAQR